LQSIDGTTRVANADGGVQRARMRVTGGADQIRPESTVPTGPVANEYGIRSLSGGTRQWSGASYA
jgi:hypothetical protein